MMFVMPAWIGFEFVQFFFKQTKNWKLDSKPLTHSAGVVFCSAKTPIRITRKLAEMIADDIKDKTAGKKTDSWDYMVLESIDYPTNNDFSHFISERYGDIANNRCDFITPSEAWSDEDNKIKISALINDHIPTRQLYQIARILTQQPLEETLTIENSDETSWPPVEPKNENTSLSLLQKQELRMLQTCDDREALENGIRTACELFGLDHNKQQERAWLWMHLVELKEYISPRRNNA